MRMTAAEHARRTDATGGFKDDAEKLLWNLLPWKAVEQVVGVLTFGAKKYAPDNWRKVEFWRSRYDAALERHLVAWRKGETHDPETKMHHLAHASCCLLFMLALDSER